MREKNIFFISVLISAAILLLGCNGMASETANDALSKNDPSLCNKLEEPIEKTKCFSMVAETKNDPQICFLSKGPVEDCIAEYAMNKRNMAPCDLLTDAAKKYTCVAKFTGDSTGRALETIMGDWKTKGLVSKCLDQCQREGITCREKCIGGKSSEIIACEKSEPDYGSAYKICVDVAYKNERTCIDVCNDVQWYTCDPPCKAQAEDK